MEAELAAVRQERFWGLTTAVRLADETAVAFLMDVTRRKQAEQALAAEPGAPWADGCW